MGLRLNIRGAASPAPEPAGPPAFESLEDPVALTSVKNAENGGWVVASAPGVDSVLMADAVYQRHANLAKVGSDIHALRRAVRAG